jgi:hypothetical protein
MQAEECIALPRSGERERARVDRLQLREQASLDDRTCYVK